MDSALAQIAQGSLRTGLPQFKVGHTVRIHQKIKEGSKERIQVFEGLIIAMNNGTGISGTITVRKVVDGIGVERVYAIHSPNIAKIEIVKESKIRRSKLYYMRGRTGKSARLKSKLLDGQVFVPQSAAEIAAQAEAEAAEKAQAAEAEAPAANSEEAPQADAEATPEAEAPEAAVEKTVDEEASQEEKTKEEPTAETEKAEEGEEKTDEAAA